ncbi:MAG: MBL fold metallo-hydrolase [Deltaproteobacteria bacterium]|nr:MBL fold metallo-hydrolase [Deltaproteobacteria bacterium]
MGMLLYPLGVGDAFSTLHYSSSYAVGVDDRWVLIDCPHPIRKMLRDGSPLDIQDIEGVVLTHLHADHASGLEGLAYYNHFMLKRKTRLLTHPRVHAQLWQGHLRAGMGTLYGEDGESLVAAGEGDFFDVSHLSVAETVAWGPFRVEARITRHPLPTTAVKLHGGGRTLAFSADTRFDPELVAWLSTADLILHETNYGIHTDYQQLAALPAALRAKMRLVHYPDDFDTEASEIEPLFEGMAYQV